MLFKVKNPKGLVETGLADVTTGQPALRGLLCTARYQPPPEWAPLYFRCSQLEGRDEPDSPDRRLL